MAKKRKKYTIFTPKMQEAAKKMLGRGVLLKDVAKDLGVHPSTITRALNKQGTSPKNIQGRTPKRTQYKTPASKLERIAGLISNKEREIEALRREAYKILKGS